MGQGAGAVRWVDGEVVRPRRGRACAAWRRVARLWLAALALAGPAVAAPPARANDDAGGCQITLVDSSGAPWRISEFGQVSGGQMAYDEYATFVVNDVRYGPPEWNTGCTREQDGREVVFPQATAGLIGLAISRRVFVPAGDDAFARWLDTIENLRDVPTRVSVSFQGSMASGSGTRVVATSSGDTRALPDNAWAVLDDAFRTDSSIWCASTAHLWDSASPLKRSGMTASGGGPADGTAAVGAVYSIVLAPRQRITLMHVAAQRRTAAEALAFARSHAGGTAELYAGMSAQQLASLENWPAVVDADADGVADAQDNCLGVASADRGDLDGDGQGDACDGDIDGDGLSNASESELGTQPRNADSDGDGLRDGADLCPRRPGPAPDGCPGASVVTVASPAPAGPAPSGGPALRSDHAPPRVVVRASRSISLAALLQGQRVRVACDEPCRVSATLLTALRSDGLRPRALSGYNHTLARAELGPGPGERTAVLKPCFTRAGRSAGCLRRMKRWLAPARPLRVALEVVARDRAGNASRRQLRLSVR